MLREDFPVVGVVISKREVMLKEMMLSLSSTGCEVSRECKKRSLERQLEPKWTG